MTNRESNSDVHAYLAEYCSAEALIEGTRQIVEAGYTDLDTFTPFPVGGLDGIMPAARNRLPLYMLIGALVGALAGYWLQHWTAVFDYPWLVGGKPMLSWPTFGPVMFELAVLTGAVSGFLAMLWGSGLPQPHHPVFAAKHFDLASRDRFFLYVRVTADQTDVAKVKRHLQKTEPFHLHSITKADAD